MGEAGRRPVFADRGADQRGRLRTSRGKGAGGPGAAPGAEPIRPHTRRHERSRAGWAQARPPMKISREEVLRVAELAHLELTESEVETYRGQLDAILAYSEKLNELDTSAVEPMAQVLYSSEAENPALRE